MKRSIALITAAAALFATSLYFSPHFAVYRMRNAIQNKDADAFSSYVDFPALRENFKTQLTASMHQQIQSEEMKNSPYASLGQVMASAIVSPMVDSLISPAGVIALMNTGRPTSMVTARISPKAEATASDNRPKAPHYSISYEGWSRVILHDDKRENEGISFVLKRDGLWGWKLSSIELPPSPFAK